MRNPFPPRATKSISPGAIHAEPAMFVFGKASASRAPAAIATARRDQGEFVSNHFNAAQLAGTSSSQQAGVGESRLGVLRCFQWLNSGFALGALMKVAGGKTVRGRTHRDMVVFAP